MMNVINNPLQNTIDDMLRILRIERSSNVSIEHFLKWRIQLENLILDFSSAEIGLNFGLLDLIEKIGELPIDNERIEKSFLEHCHSRLIIIRNSMILSERYHNVPNRAN